MELALFTTGSMETELHAIQQGNFAQYRVEGIRALQSGMETGSPTSNDSELKYKNVAADS
ncbi:hypothetical protein SAMN05216464_103198 [Mucilaginibacter pineti]|uniref:Uncharacterized protein n=1 Tax=Mucilaginibacter pineti TaxID=1391627 RepID=A0A1G6Z5E2_9SPHI|nr:hypothetical protein SAMN05216464_103198 [Mucilaginibacter pineti]